MRFTRVFAAPVAAVALAAFAAGCGGSETDGQAVPSAAGEQSTASQADESAESTETTTKATKSDTASSGVGDFDLCSTLALTDVESYVRSDKTIALRKSLEKSSYPFTEGGMVTCNYGTYIKAGLKLQMPITKRTQDSQSMRDLAKGDKPKETKVGDDRAWFSESDRENVLSVLHGKVPFVLRWEPLKDVPGETMTTDKMKQLAEKVVKKLPTKDRLGQKAIDIPKECEGIKPEAIVGKVTAARGNADPDKFSCDFTGEKGFLNFDSTTYEPIVMERNITSKTAVSPDLLITPPISPDVVLFNRSKNDQSGLGIQGSIRNCCEVDIRFEASDIGDTPRGQDFDADERRIVTEFTTAAARGGR